MRLRADVLLGNVGQSARNETGLPPALSSIRLHAYYAFKPCDYANQVRKTIMLNIQTLGIIIECPKRRTSLSCQVIDHRKS